MPKPMSRAWLSVVSVGLITLGGANAVRAADPDPAELMRESDKLHNTLTDSREKATMTLIAKDGEQRVLIVDWIAAQDTKNGDKSRITFSSPADVKGTALLSIEKKAEDEDEQWLYLPGFRKTRRIGSGELGDRFVGTDFYFEDLKRRRVEDFAYKLLRSEKIGSDDCWVIESVPASAKAKRESPYSKSIIWLRKDILFSIKARAFDKQGKPLKELTIEKLVKVAGTTYRGNQVSVVDVQRNHRTVLTVDKREANTGLPKDVFSKHTLGSE